MNSFGTTSHQYQLIDPRCVRDHRGRFRRGDIPEIDLANSYYRSSGKWPDVGWILLDRDSYNQLSPYSNRLRLVIGDFVHDSLTIDNLSIVQARCVTYGLPSDEGAIYLIQVTDNRGVLYSPWFQYPVNVQYNVNAPAYQQKNYSGSLTGANNSDAWTWTGMIQDLWDRAAPLLGDYPGLPNIPDGSPDGYVFTGVPLWDAISSVLEYLGMSVSGSYPDYTITANGAADSDYDALVAKYGEITSRHFCMEDSMSYLDVGSGRVPSQVVVYFNRRSEVCGTEEVVRYDDPQWHNTPAYSVTVASPSTFASAVGTGYLWADFEVRFDQNGNPLLEDVLTAQTIAAERVRRYFDTIYHRTSGYMSDTYSGVLLFTTGSMVDGVRWYNTGVSSAEEGKYCGWRTEVIRGYTRKEAVFDMVNGE